MNTTKKRYSYDGAVRSFDDILSVKWRGQTFAESEKKARSNLGYQFRKHMGAFSERSHPIDRENDGLLKGV